MSRSFEKPELDQVDMVVSMGEVALSWLGCHELLSKGCERVSDGAMVLPCEEEVGCHSRICELDLCVGVVEVDVVVVVEFAEDAWDFEARCLPVL